VREEILEEGRTGAGEPPPMARRRFTPLVVGEAAGAVVAVLLAAWLVWDGVRDFRLAHKISAARADHARDRLPEARQAAVSGLDSFPEDPTLLELAGSTVLGLGETQKAETFYGRLVKLEGDDAAKPARALGHVGLALVALAELDQAERDLRKEAKGGAAAAARLPADRRTAFLDRAKGELEKAVRLSPARPEPHIYLGSVALERGDAKKALEHFEAAEKAGDVPTQGALLALYHDKALAHLASGKAEEAALLLRKAVQLAPDRKELPGRVAHAMAARIGAPPDTDAEALKRAAEEGERSLDRIHATGRGGRKQALWGLDAHASTVREAIAIALFRAGDWKAAQEELEKAVRESAERTPGMLANLGAVDLALAEKLIAKDRAPKGEASQLLKEAAWSLRDAADLLTAEGEPEDPARVFLLYNDAGVLFQRAAFPTDASRCFDKAQAAIPGGGAAETPEWRAARALLERNRAVFHDKQKRPKEAVQHYLRAIELAPGTADAFAMEARVKALTR